MGWDGFNRVMEYFMVALVLVGLWAVQRRKTRRAVGSGPHSVIVRSGPGPAPDAEVQALSAALSGALSGSGLGAIDRHERAEDGVRFHLHGADADKLFAATRDILRAHPITAGGTVTLRYGEEDAMGLVEKRVAVTGES